MRTKEEEDLSLFVAPRLTKCNRNHKLKQLHESIHTASSIDTTAENILWILTFPDFQILSAGQT